ncbi:hypothetical protein F4775DRAFT_595252 [Biscogniauxia sp. FL1348]|nr:hypothetical protein F4775DRAFT_595252 [Biscogniauxia sp. FL1348]
MVILPVRDARTKNSVVWRDNTKETTAWELTSSVRFSWNNHQTILFYEFLSKVGLNYKNCDLTPLLSQLNLDGYETIKNRYGQNVHSIIITKVQRKLCNTALTMDENLLRSASLGAKSTVPSNNYDYTKKPTNDQHPPPTRDPVVRFQFEPPEVIPATPSRQIFKPMESSPSTKNPKNAIVTRGTPGKEAAKPPMSLHPILKMPAKKPQDDPTQPLSIKREPERESTPQYYQTPPKGGQANEAANNHAFSTPGDSAPRRAIATPSSGSQKATPHANAATPTPPDGISEKDLALRVLSKRLSVLTAALRGVESVIDNMEMEKDSELEGAVEDLSLGIHDMKLDVSYLQEVVEQQRDG